MAAGANLWWFTVVESDVRMCSRYPPRSTSAHILQLDAHRTATCCIHLVFYCSLDYVVQGDVIFVCGLRVGEDCVGGGRFRKVLGQFQLTLGIDLQESHGGLLWSSHLTMEVLVEDEHGGCKSTRMLNICEDLQLNLREHTIEHEEVSD